jgi:adenylate cyclase
MQFRIGINLGDIIIDDDGDIYGDGVNVAARLESLAEPGGICVSASVHDQINGRDFEFEDLGPVQVKNIPKPVHAWKVVLKQRATGGLPVSSDPFVATVAVLPFDNMSIDPEQQYFADGITEDLITALSHQIDLRVVARNSTFVYKGQAVDVRKVAKELDATHLVQGSVRRAGDRVRVTVQLIEAETGHHIWAERYDRELSDVFDLQDDIVQEMTSQVHPTIERVEGEKRAKRSPAELDAWDLLLRARWHVNTNTQDGLEEGIRLCEMAIERDPSFARARSQLASYWVFAVLNRWRFFGRNGWDELTRSAQAAFHLDPFDPFCMVMLGWSELFAGELDRAGELAHRALARARHTPEVSMFAGAIEVFVGESDAAVPHLSDAWTSARQEPWRYHIASNLSFAHYLAERYEAALAWAEQGLEVSNFLQLRAIAAAALGQLGRIDEAKRQLQHVTNERPGLTVSEFGRNIGWKHRRDIDHYLEGLVKAGMAS